MSELSIFSGMHIKSFKVRVNFNHMVRIFILILLMSTLSGCQSGHSNSVIEEMDNVLPQVSRLQIPDVTHNLKKLAYKPNTSSWVLGDSVYSGWVVAHYPNGQQKSRMGILQGKKQDSAFQWYSDGHIKQKAYYHENALHGEKKNWAPDSAHLLVAHLNYYLGKAHGEQRKWYGTGELYQIMHLNLGKEEGMQQAFRPNGDLYVNYEARNGRIFGLKRTALCYELEDEEVQYPDSK